jgi:hypothetical protein
MRRAVFAIFDVQTVASSKGARGPMAERRHAR